MLLCFYTSPIHSPAMKTHPLSAECVSRIQDRSVSIPGFLDLRAWVALTIGEDVLRASTSSRSFALKSCPVLSKNTVHFETVSTGVQILALIADFQYEAEIITQGGSWWLCQPFAVPCSVWKGWGSKGVENKKQKGEFSDQNACPTPQRRGPEQKGNLLTPPSTYLQPYWWWYTNCHIQELSLIPSLLNLWVATVRRGSSGGHDNLSGAGLWAAGGFI